MEHPTGAEQRASEEKWLEGMFVEPNEPILHALEDAGTMTSPLIPWNTCGAYMAGTLGVATFSYLPYCFFNLICPVVAVIYGFLNFKIAPLVAEPDLASQQA